jgi:hypothetical protein
MFTSTHHPSGGARLHWDNNRIEQLIASYKSSGDLESLSTIVELTENRVLTLIRFYKCAQYRSEAELLSDVNCKLIKAVSKFDASKGSAFTFVSRVVSNTLCTSVAIARKNAATYMHLRNAVASQLVSETEDKTGVDDIVHRIKSNARTALTDETELCAQRWYIESFLSDGFESRRHECANAAMSVHQLSHERSRELYDLTMLEVRRILYDDVARKRSAIAPAQLNGTKLAWMTRYAALMSVPVEFTKFVILIRDLAPYLLLIVDPANHSRRQDRSANVSRNNIELILNGDRDAVPLFNPLPDS